MFKKIFFIMTLLVALVSFVSAAIPETFNIHGKLTDSAGNAQQGLFNFTFRIYNVPTVGTALFERANQSVTTDSNGIYNVILTGINLPFSEQYYLGIQVNSDAEMSPRINLTSAPYTFRANISDNLDINRNYSVGRLGIGTTSPGAKLDIVAGDSDYPALQVSRGFDGSRIRFKYATATDAYGEIGQTYFAGGRTAIWIGANLNTSSAAHQSPTQGNSAGSTWYARFDTIDDYFAINRIAAGGGTSASSLLYIKSDGNVGIGTTSPSSKLSIFGGYQTTGLSGPPDSVKFGATGASPNAGQLIFGDNTGWKFHIGTNSGGTFIERVTVLDTGNVGIGTTNPQNKLEVAGTLNASAIRVGTTNVCLESGVNCPPGAGGNPSPFTNDTTQIFPVDSNLNFNYDSGVFFINPTTDRVGIGTMSSGQKLVVVGGTSEATPIAWKRGGGADQLGYLYSDSTGIGITNSTNGAGLLMYMNEIADSIRFDTNSATRMTIDGSGNVGIGTTGPATKLEVSGSGGSITLDPDVTNPTINTTAGNLTLTSKGGSVVIVLG